MLVRKVSLFSSGDYQHVQVLPFLHVHQVDQEILEVQSVHRAPEIFQDMLVTELYTIEYLLVVSNKISWH